MFKIKSGNKKNENSRRSETKTSKDNVQPTSRIRGGKSSRKGKNVISLTYIKMTNKQGEFCA
jgi:hypothetical protein